MYPWILNGNWYEGKWTDCSGNNILRPDTFSNATVWFLDAVHHRRRESSDNAGVLISSRVRTTQTVARKILGHTSIGICDDASVVGPDQVANPVMRYLPFTH